MNLKKMSVKALVGAVFNAGCSYAEGSLVNAKVQIDLRDAIIHELNRRIREAKK